MDINAQKEQFSRAYVQAVAAVAGYAWALPSVDDDSIDLILSAKGGGGTARRPRVELQLKCHAAKPPTGSSFSFPLKIKNYDDLRDDTIVPRILVVLLVPSSQTDWLTYTEQELSLRRAAYWVSLRSQPTRTNKTTVTVQVPRHQHFDVDGLRGIMHRINSEGQP